MRHTQAENFLYNRLSIGTTRFSSSPAVNVETSAEQTATEAQKLQKLKIFILKFFDFVLKFFKQFCALKVAKKTLLSLKRDKKAVKFAIEWNSKVIFKQKKSEKSFSCAVKKKKLQI